MALALLSVALAFAGRSSAVQIRKNTTSDAASVEEITAGFQDRANDGLAGECAVTANSCDEGQCCYLGSSCGKCPCGNKHAWPAQCGTSRVCKDCPSTSWCGVGDQLQTGAIVTIRSKGTGKYCSDKLTGLKCDNNNVGSGAKAWEKFTVQENDDGTFSLKGFRAGKWCADVGQGVVCNRGSIGTWEKFNISDYENSEVGVRITALKEDARVSCENGYAAQIRCKVDEELFEASQEFMFECVSGCKTCPTPAPTSPCEDCTGRTEASTEGDTLNTEGKSQLGKSFCYKRNDEVIDASVTDSACTKYWAEVVGSTDRYPCVFVANGAEDGSNRCQMGAETGMNKCCPGTAIK